MDQISGRFLSHFFLYDEKMHPEILVGQLNIASHQDQAVKTH